MPNISLKKVVLQLSAGKDYDIDQLLDLGITCFGLRKHLADEIDWPLDW